MKRSYSPLLLSLLLILILSCNNTSNPTNSPNPTSTNDTNEDDSVPVVSCDIAFRVEDKEAGIPCDRPILSGNVLYILERYTFSTNHILAYDIENQTILWRTCPYSDHSEWADTGKFTRDFCLVGDSLWVPFYYDDAYYLMQVKTADGSRGKTIYLGKFASGSSRMEMLGFNITAAGSKIFFLTRSGLCYCDTATATLTDSTNNLYQGEIQLAYSLGDPKTIGLLFQNIDNDFLISYRNTDDYSNCGMIRFNPNTMQKVWEIKGDDFQINYTVNNGKIFSTVTSYTDTNEVPGRFVAYDASSGASIGKYDTGVNGDTYPLCVDNKIIQTTNVNFTSSGKPMVYCLNANTLQLIWKKDVNLKNQSSGSNCQANNGIVYFPRSSGMWLYDLETGRTLGKDQSFQASDIYDSAFSFRYGNLLIIQNGDDLLGIKMNFKKGASGLVKE